MDGTRGRGRTERGFTLVELMIVIAIISILASIAIPNLMSAKLSANETSAIGTLRGLNSSQILVQGAAKIDVDSDGQGEYGTFLELSGRSRLRRFYGLGPPAYTDFSVLSPIGTELKPPAVSASLSNVDRQGFVSKAGYALMMFLPDNTTPLAKWAHEVNTGTFEAPVPDFSSLGQTGGGTGKVWVDLSENVWCCYAIPQVRGTSGNRVFFTSQNGDLLQSQNERATPPHSGTATAVDGRSAFFGDGITSKLAVGTAGKDLDVWKIAQ